MRGWVGLVAFALLAACASPATRIQLAIPQPSEAQLQTCPQPQLAGANPTDSDIALERVSVASWGICYKTRFESLVGWIRQNLMSK